MAMAMAYSRDGEGLSPAGRLFHSPSFNCYVIAILGCKTNINVEVIKEGLCHTLLKHPRFTSILVSHTLFNLFNFMLLLRLIL